MGGSDIGAKLRLGKPVIDPRRCPRSGGTCPRGSAKYVANDRKPSLHTRFKKEQSGNPRGRPKKKLPALPVAALNEPVFARIDGERRKITKRQAVIHQLVDKSTGADLRTTNMPIDMMKDIAEKAGAAPPPEPAPLIEADEEVIKFTVRRIRSAMPQEIQDQNAGNPALAMISLPLP
jgi:hypothetical protein